MSLPAHAPRVFSIVAAALLAVVGLLALIGAVLPRDWRVEESLVIEASPAEIHAFVNDLAHWTEWAQWDRSTLSPENRVSQPSAGPGAQLSWYDQRAEPSRVAGEVRIVESDPARGVWFENRVRGADPSRASLTFTPRAGGTVVTWQDSGRLTPIVGSLFRDYFQQKLSAHMATGLERLREKVRTQPSRVR